jgi:hypothetical protein
LPSIAATCRCHKVNPTARASASYRAVTTVLKAGVTPIIVGGDRSISIQAARALSDHIGAGKTMGCLSFRRASRSLPTAGPGKSCSQHLRARPHHRIPQYAHAANVAHIARVTP